MLWLGIALPSLPLDLLCRGTADALPLAVLEDSKRIPRVLHCNGIARRLGVRPGMSLNAALVLCPGLRYRHHDPNAIQAAQERLAGWAGRFSPRVSLDSSQGILLEIEGSLNLFGGLDALCRRVAEGVTRLGYRAVLAVAPFPLAASLLARGGQAVKVCSVDELTACLGQLPVTLLGLDNTVREGLASVGIRRLAELFSMPRDGLARRFGPQLVDYLDRLVGRQPDLRPAFIPAPSFRTRLELPAPSEEREALLFATNRLLQELDGLLAARASGIEGFELVLRHASDEPTRLYLGLAQPGRDPRHWLDLLRVRLEALTLDRPVEAIEVRAEHWVTLPGTPGNLFEVTSIENGTRLLERLQARLGEAAVRGLTPVPDHRPERAWRWVGPGEAGPGMACPPRPLWLLSDPVPLDNWLPSNWRLWGPERIESGWWDGADVSRDYFIAEAPSGECWWVFQERRGAYRWFLHGLFA